MIFSSICIRKLAESRGRLLGRTDRSDYLQNLDAVNRCLKMAKRTQKEIQALKDAGYVYNQREQRWMSQEELQQWNDNKEREHQVYFFIKWVYILFFVGVFVFVFASSMN